MIIARKFGGSVEEINYNISKDINSVTVTISSDINAAYISEIDLDYFESIAQDGDEGYMIIPNEGMLCNFKNHINQEYISNRYTMPIFGAKTPRYTFVAIVKGMSYNYKLVCGVRNGKYYIFPRFVIDGDQLYEDIVITYYYLKGEDADYSGMARTYRKYQLDRGECVPLKLRAQSNPYLAYARDSIMIRIRIAWKPVPTEVLHQNLHNEPAVFVACNFDRVCDILNELKRQGVDKAEICLVGWNTKGHDGRWPQCFPVCQEAGGEEKLRLLIKQAQSMGYQIVCHSNSTDTYEISNMWNRNDLIEKKDGSYPKDASWSGGQMYQLCPEIALEQARRIFPEIAELGFRGIHYIDVLNIVMPRKCYNKRHLLNVGESIEMSRQLMKLAQDTFGGYSSEGGYDFGAKYQDYALNIDYGEKQNNPLCDEIIPLWQLVYHGIILYNPDMTKTLNFSVSNNIEGRLKVIEYGGRPTYYYNSCFRGDWKANNRNDLLCNNSMMLENGVSSIRDGYDLYNELSYLQNEFMEKHEKISEGIFKTTYSNGIKITVDYNNLTYTIGE